MVHVLMSSALIPPSSVQQASRAPAYDQKPMLDQQPVNPQQQAYLQHVELIQQHKAVEAHQRLMAQQNDMASFRIPCKERFSSRSQDAGLTCVCEAGTPLAASAVPSPDDKHRDDATSAHASLHNKLPDVKSRQRCVLGGTKRPKLTSNAAYAAAGCGTQFDGERICPPVRAGRGAVCPYFMGKRPSAPAHAAASLRWIQHSVNVSLAQCSILPIRALAHYTCFPWRKSVGIH